MRSKKATYGLKRRVFQILELQTPTDVASKIFNIFMLSLISLNVLAVILETVKNIAIRYSAFFLYFEIISVIIFTIELVLRVWTCTANPGNAHPIYGRIRFILTPLALIDILAVLPFYLPLLIPVDLRFVRALRLLRLFRVFKLGRYSNALKIMGRVLRQKREELLISLFVVGILLILASSLMYHIEHAAQPDKFSSIPATMWWGISTLTTVGYGDVTPITPLGKLLGAVIALLGIGIFALPAGILASGFASAIQRKEAKCPYCGKVMIQSD